jgi:hypothetical protein
MSDQPNPKELNIGPETSEVRKETFASTLVHGPDLVLTAIILAFCGLIYYWTSEFEEVPQILAQNLPPEWFPQLLVWTIIVLTLSLPFEHLFMKAGKKNLDEDRKVKIKPMAIVTALLLFGIVVMFETLGTIISMILICILLPLLWGERRLKMIFAFAVIFPSIVTFVFSNLLKVYFEPGILALLLP